MVLINDPYIGGTHHNDMRAVMPFYFDGSLAGFVQNSMHWTDIGGHVPGTFDSNSRSSYGEGLAVPPIHVVREGVFQPEVSNLILRNVRMADTARGDLLTSIGAVRLGESRLQALARRYGTEMILAAMDEFIEYSEDLLRAEFASSAARRSRRGGVAAGLRPRRRLRRAAVGAHGADRARRPGHHGLLGLEPSRAGRGQLDAVGDAVRRGR